MAYLPSRLEGGTVVSGDYPTIEWGSGSYFLTTKIDTNGGTNYLITATACETHPVVNPTNHNEILVTWVDGLTLAFTLNEIILTLDTSGQGVDFIKD